MHGVTHQGQNAQPPLHPERFNLAHFNVTGKFFVQPFDGLVNLGFLHGDGDAVF